jgi:hypothetical protein
MKKYTVEISVGDYVAVGRFRNVTTQIKDITVDDHGQPIIHTNKGPKKLFNCRLTKLEPNTKTARQILQEK